MTRRLTSACLFIFLIVSCSKQPVNTRLGTDRLLDEFAYLIESKKIGLITNPTGVSSKLESTVDLLHDDDRFNLVALFGPEHGVRGDVKGGIKVDNFNDNRTGIPVYSLYGQHYKPTPEMLAGVEVLVFDIQDIGIRPYTYIYTMARAMEAARENNLPFIVLDRPNPMGGELVSGPVLEPEFSSGIGLYPIPYIHGMTVGELARLFNDEFGIGCDLTVVPIENWTRAMFFSDTGLTWVPTSPHIPRPESCFYIATTGGYGELGTISEGVGTPQPFELCGAPWVDPDRLAGYLNEKNLQGVYFRPVYFRPYYLRFIGEQCGGVQIHISDFSRYDPMAVEMHILTGMKNLFPDRDYIGMSSRKSSFDRAFGTDKIRAELTEGMTAEEIINGWQPRLAEFMKIRSKYLIYD